MAVAPSPASSFSLRPAVPGDFDAYMDAFESVAAEGRWMGTEAPIDRAGRRAGFDRAVTGDDAVVFVADAGGEIVGAVYAGLSGGVADLGMFVVAGHRGGGVGRALLEAVIDWARVAGAHKVSLAAWPTNHPAIGLYARYGFRVEGTRRRHYRRRSGALWDSVVMGLVLDEESEGGPGPAATAGPPAPIVVPDGGIAGSGIVLREWRRADIPGLIRLVDDPQIRRWLDRIPDPYTADDAAEYIAGTRVQLTAGTAAGLAVVVDDALAGSVGLRIDAVDRSIAEIGYWVAAGARGRGVAPAAARLLSDFGCSALGLRRIELNAAVGNVASRRVAEKAGFAAEGVRRAWRAVGGVPTDFALYSRIADPD
jgi:RimJ/RimL family protein N-acetyltransferase